MSILRALLIGLVAAFLLVGAAKLANAHHDVNHRVIYTDKPTELYVQVLACKEKQDALDIMEAHNAGGYPAGNAKAALKKATRKCALVVGQLRALEEVGTTYMLPDTFGNLVDLTVLHLEFSNDGQSVNAYGIMKGLTVMTSAADCVDCTES